MTKVLIIMITVIKVQFTNDDFKLAHYTQSHPINVYLHTSIKCVQL